MKKDLSYLLFYEGVFENEFCVQIQPFGRWMLFHIEKYDIVQYEHKHIIQGVFIHKPEFWKKI